MSTLPATHILDQYPKFHPILALITGWRIISKIFASTPLHKVPPRVSPLDFGGVLNTVQDKYIAATRDCDATKMADVFHPEAQSTCVEPHGVSVAGCNAFCEDVAQRWSLPRHKPYAHLLAANTAGCADTLLSIDFADHPDVALAMLRVGVPPLLYTDLLSLLRSNGQWWIVAKSSINVPFLADQAQ